METYLPSSNGVLHVIFVAAVFGIVGTFQGVGFVPDTLNGCIGSGDYTSNDGVGSAVGSPNDGVGSRVGISNESKGLLLL